MWSIIADREGEKWQNVEAKVFYSTCASRRYSAVNESSNL